MKNLTKIEKLIDCIICLLITIYSAYYNLDFKTFFFYIIIFALAENIIFDIINSKFFKALITVIKQHLKTKKQTIK